MLRLSGELYPKKTVKLHGAYGFSRKGWCPTCASMYSSLPKLKGKIEIQLGKEAKKQFDASSWFDHEFGTDTLPSDTAGWDWFGVQLDSGWEVMAFQIRNSKNVPSFSAGTIISPFGATINLDRKEFKIEPQKETWLSKRGGRYPLTWKISLTNPNFRRTLHINADLADQEMVPTLNAPAGKELVYWEGTATVTGKETGHAYIEMTGYDPNSKPRF